MATLPTTKTEISFASAWDAASPTWVDVTSYVRSIEINRGRAEDLNPFDSGQARVTLDNRDGRFNPSNTAGPYYPNVKPRKQIRITSTYEVPTRTNLCTNPSFEVDTTAWALTGTAARTTAEFFRGIASLSMSYTSAAIVLAAPNPRITCVAGNSYTASFYLKQSVDTGLVVCNFMWYNSGGTLILDDTHQNNNPNTTWQRFSQTKVAPATAVTFAFRIYQFSGEGGGATSTTNYLDAVLIEQSSTVGSYFDGSSPGAQWTGTANNSTSTSTRTNLITNPSFETNTAGWNPNGSTNTRVTATWGTGDYAYQIVHTGTGLGGTFSNFNSFAVSAGQNYTASFYAKSISGTLRQLQIAIQWYNSAGTFISGSTNSQTLATNSKRWSVTGTAPATAVHALITAYTMSTGSIGDTWQMDSVLVEESSTVNQYFDGSSSGISSWTGTVNNSVSVERTTSWPLFRGYVQTWPQEYPEYGLDATSTITAVDGLAILGGMKTPIDEMAARISAGELPALFARWKLGDTDTTMPRYIDSSGNGRDFPAVMGQFTGPPLAKYLDDASSVFAYGNGSQGLAIDTFHTSFTISMWIQTTGVGSGAFIQPFFYAGVAGQIPTKIGVQSDGTVYAGSFDFIPGIPPVVTSSVKVNDGQPHHICYVSGGGNKIYVDGVNRSVATATSSQTGQLFGQFAMALPIPGVTDLQYYGYMQDLCIWTSALTDTQIGYVYGIGTGLASGELTSARATRLINAIWPAASKSIATGSGYCSTSEYNENALNALQKVADTEGSLFFVDRSGTLTLRNRYYWSQVAEGTTSQATFGDDQGISYESMGFNFDADQMANTFVINSGIGVTQTAADTAMVTMYGPRTQSIDTLLSTADALAMAQGLAAQYSEPVLRSEPFNINLASDINATRLLNLELGFKFTLRRNAKGVTSTIVQNLSLDSVQHLIEPGRWTATIGGSPRQQYAWFVLDSSLLDGTDEIGY